MADVSLRRGLTSAVPRWWLTSAAPHQWLTSAAPHWWLMSAAPSHGVSTHPLTRSVRQPFTSSTFKVLLTKPHDVTPTTTPTPRLPGTAPQLHTNQKVVQGSGNQCDVIFLKLLLAAILDWGGGQAILDPYILLTTSMTILTGPAWPQHAICLEPGVFFVVSFNGMTLQ